MIKGKRIVIIKLISSMIWYVWCLLVVIEVGGIKEISNVNIDKIKLILLIIVLLIVFFGIL